MSSCYYDVHRECVEGDCCSPLPADNTPAAYPPQTPRWQRDRDRAEGFAEGERAATERHVEQLRRMADDTPHFYIAGAYRMLADAIERGMHNETKTER